MCLHQLLLRFLGNPTIRLGIAVGDRKYKERQRFKTLNAEEEEAAVDGKQGVG